MAACAGRLSPFSLVASWFPLKPLVSCLVAEQAGTVTGVAGLRHAVPGSCAGDSRGRWLEACRLAVHPLHRGGDLTHELIAARISSARDLGAVRLWLRCVEGSRAHQLYLANGWIWWARTEFEGAASCQQAVLLARSTGTANPSGRVPRYARTSRCVTCGPVTWWCWARSKA